MLARVIALLAEQRPVTIGLTRSAAHAAVAAEEEACGPLQPARMAIDATVKEAGSVGLGLRTVLIRHGGVGRVVVECPIVRPGSELARKGVKPGDWLERVGGDALDLFAFFDEDGDGAVTLDELTGALRKLNAAFGRDPAATRFNGGGGGTEAPGEAKSGEAAPDDEEDERAVAIRLMHRFDKDGNGVLDMVELIELLNAVVVSRVIHMLAATRPLSLGFSRAPSAVAIKQHKRTALKAEDDEADARKIAGAFARTHDAMRLVHVRIRGQAVAAEPAAVFLFPPSTSMREIVEAAVHCNVVPAVPFAELCAPRLPGTPQPAPKAKVAKAKVFHLFGAPTVSTPAKAKAKAKTPTGPAVIVNVMCATRVAVAAHRGDCTLPAPLLLSSITLNGSDDVELRDVDVLCAQFWAGHFDESRRRPSQLADGASSAHLPCFAPPIVLTLRVRKGGAGGDGEVEEREEIAAGGATLIACKRMEKDAVSVFTAIKREAAAIVGSAWVRRDISTTVTFRANPFESNFDDLTCSP